MTLKISTLPCAIPCYHCDRNPSSIHKNSNPCPSKDIEQAKDLGYCTYALMDNAWATITQNDIFPIGSEVILKRDPSKSIFTEIANLKGLGKVVIEGSNVTQEF